MIFVLRKTASTLQHALKTTKIVVIVQSCLEYVYEIIIFSTSVEEQFYSCVIIRLAAPRIRCFHKIMKVIVFMDHVEYLGHDIRPGKLYNLEQVIEVVRRVPSLTDKTKLKSLLGLFNVYSILFSQVSKVCDYLTRF